MVILGLGSNLDDRLTNLRLALSELKKISNLSVEQCSPIYISDALIPENAPDDWNQPYLNCAVRCTTTLKPDELLKSIKYIEFTLGRKSEARHWGPRVIDIDILAWDDLIIHTENLRIPHPELPNRPFALWPFADLAPFWIFPLPGINQGKTAAQMVESWDSRFNGKAPFRTRQIYQRIDTPQLVGVLNITPDSFSDGGQFLNLENAIQHIFSLIHAGADIIDIGAESTAPYAQPIDSQTEWARIQPILTAIKEEQDNFFLRPKISVDTRHPDVAQRAVQFGVDWVNDVGGLMDRAMIDILSQTKQDIVMMHQLSLPASRELTLPRNQNPVKLVYDWAATQLDKLERFGIGRDRIIVDPGIGFGKTAEQSFALIKHIKEFKNLSTRLLVGHSRKSFLSHFIHYPAAERDIETLTISLYLANQAVNYLRLHNVEMCARGFRLMRAL